MKKGVARLKAAGAASAPNEHHSNGEAMNQLSQDLRKKALDLALDAAGPAAQSHKPVVSLIDTWLASVEEEDLADLSPEILASVLWDGFSRIAGRSPDDCQIEALRYADGRGGHASALLILNRDMPFLVDSIVMALRRMRIPSRAVVNAVLSVGRGPSGVERAATARSGTDPLESYVLVLLADEIAEAEMNALVANIRMVAGDAAAVHRDAAAIAGRFATVAADVAARGTEEGREVAAFLEWAKNGGFEAFGYAYYTIDPKVGKLVRDVQSRIGVLKDQSHPVYDKSLAGIPEDLNALAPRADTLSVVKADTQSTLHRDQRLDFVGVRDTAPDGEVRGEHCFVGLFSRAASATPIAQMPFARVKIKQVLQLAGVRSEGFRAEKFVDILESLPRTEVLEASPEWLADVCGTVVALYKQPRAKVFARPDLYGRHLNVLVYMPRERYSSALVDRLSTGLRSLSGATDVRVQTLLSDGPLARVYFIANAARLSLDLVNDIQVPLLAAVDGWHIAFENQVDAADSTMRSSLRRLAAMLPADYIAATPPHVAYLDLRELLRDPESTRVKVHIETGPRNMVNIRLLSRGNAPSLSTIMPALSNAGVAVDREQTNAIPTLEGATYYATCLTVDEQSAAKLAQPHVADAAQELFEQLFNNEAEDGRMNGLVIEAGLRQKEVQVVRAYASYWRQAGSKFSLRYMADCLRKQPKFVRTLIDSFSKRFDPKATADDRAAATTALSAMKKSLGEVNHADTEDILRSIADLILATLRTSYYQSKQIGDTIIFKFNSSQLNLLPEPKPYREIFVFSRRFEGVHLRGGPVARGGLRWSDRMEDYRTEVLGLVKAQMVKNAVIVPAGAKGGFVCKMMPKDATRDIIAAEGEAVYRLFIAGLLDVTDNRSKGAIVPPAETVCYDDADPYLVVAADKGTATFSDIANGIAVSRGFWLGDAFASGGSNGYDHKKLGITAKGAWEAVKRHFYEMGHDMNTTPFTVVGVGDMSGDVFGNGMLLSDKLKLVAAFDHRHIFIDPNPDVAVSFKERQRMFALPRSSWEDYDKSLISKGGGVYPRSARTIELSPEARAALGIEAASMTPEQLMRAILMAPVDMFYNGGIGTYIKAATESHAQVKDRANDAIRVNGSELRCKIVSEGGNLGATQSGRIEFASKGGRIFTDAIDNSAGVDCSDHEVNVKIWLDTEVNLGKLDEAERNRVLTDITDDICRLVLRDNELQTHLLTREVQAQDDAAVVDAYAALITNLEAEGAVSRELEQLPSDAELMRRKAEGRGLTAPELAVVVANVKNRYKRILGAQTLTGYSWARTLLTPYFPQALVASRDPLDHPLANAILATVLANEVINRCGPLMTGTLARTHLVKETDVITAWAQGWASLNLAPVFDTLDAHALLVPREVSKAVDQRTRALLKAVIEGVLAVPEQQREGAGFAELTALFGNADSARQLMALSASSPNGHGSNDAFGKACIAVEAIEGMADFLFAALSVQRPAGMGLPAFIQVGMAVRRQSGIDNLEHVLTRIRVEPQQEGLRSHALQVLRRAQQRLLMQVLQQIPVSAGGAEVPVKSVEQAMSKFKLVQQAGSGQPTFEQAVLDVWALSEAVSPSSGAA
jgi:glutamate dehydrogenase